MNRISCKDCKSYEMKPSGVALCKGNKLLHGYEPCGAFDQRDPLSMISKDKVDFMVEHLGGWKSVEKLIEENTTPLTINLELPGPLAKRLREVLHIEGRYLAPFAEKPGERPETDRLIAWLIESVEDFADSEDERNEPAFFDPKHFQPPEGLNDPIGEKDVVIEFSKPPAIFDGVNAWENARPMKACTKKPLCPYCDTVLSPMSPLSKQVKCSKCEKQSKIETTWTTTGVDKCHDDSEG